MIGVYVIDDHPVIASGLKMEIENLQTRIRVIGHATTVAGAISEIFVLNPSVILLDLVMGKNDPIVDLRCIKKLFPNTPVAIYTGFSSVEFKMLMYKEGAMAFIDKMEDPRNICYDLLEVAAGKKVITNDLLSLPLFQRFNSREKFLDPKDSEILYYHCKGKLIKQIAGICDTSEKTVCNTLRNARILYNVESNADLRILLGKEFGLH